MKNDNSNEKFVVSRSNGDPVWWVENVLGDKLWDKQKEILEAVRDYDEVTIKACHGPGKSFTAARIAKWFLYNHYPSMVLTTAPTDRQVKGIIWKEIRMAHAAAKFPLGGDMLTQTLKLGPGWFATGFTAPDYDPDRFQGFHENYILVIIDEASGVSDLIREAIDSILTSQNSKLVMIGNPTNPTGHFAKSFKIDGFKKISISAFDTPNFTEFGITEDDIKNDTYKEKIGDSDLPYPKLVTPNWVKKRYDRWKPTSPIYKARVLSIFPTESEDTLIPMEWVEAAKNRVIEPGKPVILGADIGAGGTDDSCIAMRQGDVGKILKTFSEIDTMKTANHIAKALIETNASNVRIDTIGVGKGPADRLYELDYPVIHYNSCHTPVDTEDGVPDNEVREKDYYANARAQDYWNLRIRFEEGRISLPDCDENLEAQLSNIKYFIKKGKIQIESKEEMKERKMPSPNEMDALVMAFSEAERPEPRMRSL